MKHEQQTQVLTVKDNGIIDKTALQITLGNVNDSITDLAIHKASK